MNNPSVSDLLVQKVQETERLCALLIANECETLEEFRGRLSNMIELIHV